MKVFLFLILTVSLFGQAGYFEPWGTDADLKVPPSEKVIIEKKTVPEKVVQSIISFHQNFLSPVSGSRCQFRPTCSRYMQLAIKRYGLLQGILMGCDRLQRCDCEDWVYRVKQFDGKLYKYDPAKK